MLLPPSQLELSGIIRIIRHLYKDEKESAIYLAKMLLNFFD